MISCLSSVRRNAVVLVTVCALVRCDRESRSEFRLIEPRIRGFDAWQSCTKQLPAGHVVETADCGTANLPRDLVSLAVSECDGMMKTANDAVRLAAYVPQCTDAAVEKLSRLASQQADATLLSDLAAAYYVRAQRKDQPSDLVRALDAADRAVALAPAMPEARFNRALAQEALGFLSDAIESWDALRKPADDSWAGEAGEHYERLLSQRSRGAAIQWNLNKNRLAIAAKARDRAALEQLVAPYHAAAQRYVETDVLPEWARASIEHRGADAAAQLDLAEMIASAIAGPTHDRYLLDAIERIRSSRGEALRTLEDAHLAFAAARDIARGLKESPEREYARAERLFAAAGSPFQFGAALGRVASLTQTKRHAEALALLRAVERASLLHHYPSLRARVHTGRGYLMTDRGREIDALAEYAEAQSIFEQIHDSEDLGNVQNVIIGLYRRIGDTELTWRAALQAQRYTPDLVEAQSRHVQIGENAVSAVELGYPSVGLHYQNIAVRMLQDELSHSTGTAATIAQLRVNLGIALRTRAGIRVLLRDYAGAESDLGQGMRLIGTPADPRETAIPSGFQARLAEVRAQKLAKTNRKLAIAALTQAIRLALTTPYQTLIASLRMQRAELYRLEGDPSAAETDLKSAIAAMREQERATLENAKLTPQTERLWSAYFSRSQEAYRRLIRHYVETGADRDAFEYAEKARAYEPLHLILKRPDLPSAFRERIRDGEPFRLSDVEQVLPTGTFLLEYAVLDDRTYVWIIGDGRSKRLTLPVGESTIREWTHAVQKSAALRIATDVEAVFSAPYKHLLEQPLALVARRGGATARLVIVPDRSMHGLPYTALRNGARYLIQDHRVSVAGSATLYAYSAAQDQALSRRGTPSVLLFADPAFNPKLEIARQLSRLSTARSEVQRIAALYASVARVEPPRTDDRATVPELLRLAPPSTIIHIAAHGIANPDTPSGSFLLLAPTDDDSGAIDAERLLTQLQLKNTRLAVLSACSSAGGTPVGPEGLAPLVRPLIAGGVPGVVGTLWNVSDNLATEDLLVRFHQHYRDGHDADDALRLAQLEMLASPQIGHRAVWAWAAFQMIGYASSPFPASTDEKRRSK